MFLSKKNIIMVLIALELILLSINFNFIVFSILLDDYTGQIFSLFILSIGACDTSLGLAILIMYYRLRGGISIDFINLLKS